MPIKRIVLMRIQRSEDAAEAAQRSFRDDVIEGLDPDISVTRYGRVWRISLPQFFGPNDRYVWAKIGFLRSRGELAAEYDEENYDFIPIEGTGGQGQFSYFVIDRRTQYMAFEQTTEIRPQSIRGALRKMFNEKPDLELDVDVVSDPGEFFDWLNAVTTVARVAVSVRQPNPHWDDRFEAVQDLIGETGAARVSVEAVAPKGDSLKVQGTDLAAFVEYAGEGYGRVSASGREGATRSDFDSEQAIRSGEIEVTPADTEQSIVRKIVNALSSLLP